MLIRFILLGFAIISLQARAIDTNELKAKALQELQKPGRIVTPQSEDNSSTNGVLSLKDPEPELSPRKWDFVATFSIQQFQAHGKATNDLTNTVFDVGSAGSTVLPALGFSAHHLLIERESWNLKFGLGAQIAYTSQNANATFNTGFSEGVHINSLIFAGLPGLTLQLQRLPRFLFGLGMEYGSVNITQASNNALANYSIHSPYMAWDVSVDFSLMKHWTVFTLYSNRWLTGSNTQIALQRDNYQLGTRWIW